MRAALWSKLKSAGPLLGFDQELQRLRFWLPPRLRPLLVEFFYWQQRYRQALSVAERLAIEQQALLELRGKLNRLPERSLLDEFFNRVDSALHASLTARSSALLGEPVDPALDRRLYQALLGWLADGKQGPERELSGWLERLLQAWWMERLG